MEDSKIKKMIEVSKVVEREINTYLNSLRCTTEESLSLWTKVKGAQEGILEYREKEQNK